MSFFHHPAPAARSWRAILALCGAVVLVASGCSRRAEPGPQTPARDAEWIWLVQTEQQLTEKRARLPQPPVAAAPASPSTAAAPAAAGPPPHPAWGAAAPADPASREVDALAAELSRRLIAYINADPPREGTPLSPRQLAAIRMRSDEEIAVAQEYIARAGDYRRAIDIYEAALAADPRNPRLRAELAGAQAARYLAADRFARVTPGMTADQVRDVLGPPNARDVRTYNTPAGAQAGPVVAWFYPRDAAGSAAAVWFEHHNNTLLVYRTDWDALPPITSGAPVTPAPAPPPHDAP